MYTYFYSPSLNEIDDITNNNYDNIQLHDIEICDLVQKLTYICCGHIRLMIEDTRNSRVRKPKNRAVKWGYPQNIIPLGKAHLLG